MPNQILQVDENMLETKLDRLVSEKVEQLLNAMLDAEADEITGAARYERSGERRAYRAGHYERNLTVKAGTMTLKVPKLKGALFESAVIERYRRREESVEEALIDMYLAGVSTRQVDDISRLLWGERMPSQTLSDKLKKVYEDIDRWRNRPLTDRSYPYLFVDGVWCILSTRRVPFYRGKVDRVTGRYVTGLSWLGLSGRWFSGLLHEGVGFAVAVALESDHPAVVDGAVD